MTPTSKDIWCYIGIAATWALILGLVLPSRPMSGFSLGVLLCVIGRLVEGRKR